ncbi:3,4-dihydroxy-9,10-secoandrosta-1,3,5(10)-triene-9,17-dione 4,5-dioxygenase [Mycobacteroides chelonae]|nr:3,4-dihydroxy-9,10-secoandrosta-1,3,5(10)-triene-9,17-dione 4,5-dioxygenase [Mycobacteroides chelonae]
MNLRGIGYFGLNVPNQREWDLFAKNIIGLKPVDAPTTSDGMSYFKADERAWRVAVRQSDTAGVGFVGFEVPGESEFSDAVAELDRAGYAARLADRKQCRARLVQALAVVQGPGGLDVEIFWGPRNDGPFRSPVAVPSFVTEGGLGHMVQFVPDMKEAMHFYCGVLGFKVTDFLRFGGGTSLQFLRCTPRHHTMALMGVGPVSGTHHIAFEVPDVDTVGRALDRAQRGGHEITATLGRHQNDRMLSFYMRSPAGFEVEIGCDPQVIDDNTWVAKEFAGADLWGHDGLTKDAMEKAVKETDSLGAQR